MTAREQLAVAVLMANDEDRCIAALRALQGADAEPLLSAEEVCRRLGVSRSTWHRMRIAPSWRSGQVLRWTWGDVMAKGAGGAHGRRKTEDGNRKTEDGRGMAA